MSRQRKQKFPVREIDLMEVEMKRTPAKAPSTHDPFLLASISNSPADLLREASSVLGDLSPVSFVSEDITNMPAFLDAIPNVWSVESLENSPCFLEPRREVFQDLSFDLSVRDPITSTPKPLLCDSGIQVSSGKVRKRIDFTGEDKLSRKRIRFDSEGTSKEHTVLHDITHTQANSTNSFVNIASNISFDDSVLNSKKCSIIRRPNKGEFKGPLGMEDVEKVTYYTGLRHFQSVRNLLNTVRIPGESGLTSTQVVIMCLTQLRLNLEWKDLSFRFDAKEEIIAKIFEKTLTKLAVSLRAALPWMDSREPDVPKLIYLHPVYFRDDFVQQMIVCVTNDSSPVLYVSDAFNATQKPLKVLETDLVSRIRSGDLICCRGYGKKSKEISCFSISPQPGMPGTLQAQLLKDTSPYRAHVWEIVRVIERLMTFKMFLGKYKIPEAQMKNILTVIGALTNINYSVFP